MVVTVKEAIFLGNFADADTDESTTTIENTAVYDQTFGSIGSPLFEDEVDLTFDDPEGDNQIITDNAGGSDTITGASGTTVLDSLAVVAGTVTYVDGTTASYTNVVMFQTDNGDLYLTNSDFAGTDLNGSGKLIRSFEVTSITSTNYNGLYHQNMQEFACFAAGTQIETPRGERPIETLGVGDCVVTMDRGAQPIRWIGQSTVLGLGAMAPVRISKGALGQGLPAADLLVSQQHRILMRSPIAERMTGQADVLIAAKALVPLHGIDIVAKVAPITYFHMLFDHHELVTSNGAISESLLPGPQAMEMLGPHNAREIQTILKRKPTVNAAVPARLILSGKQRRQAILRHIKNAKPIWNGDCRLVDELRIAV